jgi:hypothetical protein
MPELSAAATIDLWEAAARLNPVERTSPDQMNGRQPRRAWRENSLITVWRRVDSGLILVL